MTAGTVARANKYFSYLKTQLKAQNSHQPKPFLFGKFASGMKLSNNIEAFSKFYQILSVETHNEVKQLTQTIDLIVLFMPMEAHINH